ncbi:hypothetical protein J5TS2_24160 [Brevibacillus halotolerans]|nr:MULTISPECIES: hypothetical protein [Brevibacillus]GIO01748.1 hypothetical protein J5TS2_24160 [Brevibacillus halotolerans]
MNIAIKNLPTESKVLEINQFISGYWENDIWDAEDPIFDNFRKASWENSS